MFLNDKQELHFHNNVKQDYAVQKDT